jgi:hypothetical protein
MAPARTPAPTLALVNGVVHAGGGQATALLVREPVI